MLGVFDSGVGGLTVLRSIREQLPDISITYLGDNARTPYGDCSRAVVTKYTKEACHFLFERGCSLIILACNTASAETLRELQHTWLPALRKNIDRPINILGVIRPLAEEAVQQTKSNCIGIVGTRSTISSGTYEEEIKELMPSAKIIQKACPLIVPIVEEKRQEEPETRKILKTYLNDLCSHNPDVLILGCTHYEALHSIFVQMIGGHCQVLHSPDIVARKLVDYLRRHLEYELPSTGEMNFLTTGDPERFVRIGSCFYGQQIDDVEKVVLQSALAF